MQLLTSLMGAAPLLQAGKVGVMPTDTVYGLVALAQDAHAVHRLYKLKHREHKPGTLIAASVEQLTSLGIPRRYLKPVEHYWPGSISIVIPAPLELRYLHQGKGSLAVRIPDSEPIRELLSVTGPLLTTSANLPSEPTAQNTTQAQHYFHDTVDFYVDGGDITESKPSTIIRIVDDAVEVLRRGAVEINEQGEKVS